jgi:DNA-binding SARP family transcriptional activator
MLLPTRPYAIDCRVTPPTCRLSLLGVPQLCVDGRAVAIDRRKPLALLVYIAVEGITPRARVAALLWPDLPGADARRNLRRELARLRELGAGDLVHTTDDTLDLATIVTCDVRQLLTTRDAVVARALMRGPLLEGVTLADAPAFEDWLLAARDRLMRQWRAVLLHAAQAAEAAGRLEEALAHIESLHHADPLREVTVRDLMRLHAARGNRAAALLAFDRFSARLASEMALSPLPETLAQAQALRQPIAAAPVSAAPSATPAAASTATGHDHRAPRIVLPRQVPFVGRASEVQAVQRAWREGRIVVLLAEAGAGKTRMATDFAASLGAYLHVACRPVDRDAPFGAASRVLRELMSARPDVELTPDLNAELARILPELGSAPPLTTADARQRFFDACARAADLWAAGNFGVVVIDDWHNADAAARALLLSLAQRAATPARWLLAARGGELDAPARAELTALEDAGVARVIALGALSPAEVADLIQALARAPAPRFAARLAQATGCNPFFLVETLRHLCEHGLVQPDAHGRWQTPFDDTTDDYRELPLPPTVRDTVRARVARLGEPAMRLLEAASLAGDPFRAPWLADTTGTDEAATVSLFEAAEHAQLLVADAKSGTYRFAHDLVPQALAAGLSPARAALVHRRLALNLDRAHPGDSPMAARIARHWEAAGEPRRAIGFRLAAGEAAARLYAHREALAEFDQALAHGPEPAVEVRLRNAKIDALRHLGDIAARSVEADHLAALARSRGDRNEEANAVMQRALAAADGSRRREALRLMEHAVALKPDDESTLLRALRIAGWAATTCGETRLAERYVQQALPLAERIDASAACGLLSTLLRLASDRGDYAEGRRLFASARVHPGLKPKPFVEYHVLTDGARLLEAQGDRTEAIRLQHEALALAERIGAAPNLLVGRFNLMRMLLNDGQLDAARPLVEGFRPLAEQIAHSQNRYAGLSAQAQLAAAEERWAEAIALGERVIELCDSLHDPLQSRIERVFLGRVYLGCRRWDNARALARAAQAIDNEDGRLLLSARMIALEAEFEQGARPAAELLADTQAALAATAQPEEERQAGLCHAELLQARLHLALGDTAAACTHAERVYFTPALRAQALVVRVAAGAPAQAEAQALLASGQLAASKQALLARALAAASGPARA